MNHGAQPTEKYGIIAPAAIDRLSSTFDDCTSP